MYRIKDKRHLLALIFSAKIDEEERRSLLQQMLETGEVTEHEMADFMVEHIEKNEGAYRQLFEQDELLQFLLERFRDKPDYLARALVRVRPDIFYAYGVAFRISMKLRADLGRVWIKPKKRGGDNGPDDVTPIAQLPHEVEEDIFALDMECTFREYLYYFCRNFADGMSLLETEIAAASSNYDRRVLQAVQHHAERLVRTTYPGVVTELFGQPFPALHVRWWLDQSKNEHRVLNMGDTGTYKTAYAALSVRLQECRRTLVITAPHARHNWARELRMYFTDLPRIQVIESKHDVKELDPAAEFVIVGYSTVIYQSVVAALLAHGFDGLIQDECHYGNNVSGANPAARALAVARLAKDLPLTCYRALSATPWENRPEELASIAVTLRPELFTSPEAFIGSGAAKNPRLLRELFAGQILEIELREVCDLPRIEPKPWEDLFSAVPVRMNPRHARIYALAYEDGTDEPEPAQKALRLLMAATHPPLLEERMPWNEEIQSLISDWKSSTKLEWIRRFVEKRIATRKIVIATGLYAEGITRNEDDETQSVAALLREWFGEERIVVLDGTVAITGPNANGNGSQRDAVIRRWRNNPEARILLVSMQACPDSVNLTVGRLPGIEGLSITALSFGWKPWKQFLGRFWRQGQELPVEYQVPVLVGTIDEDLLCLNRDKWQAQQLFRALAPMTEQEWSFLGPDGPGRLRDLLRDAVDHVNVLSSMFRGRGERGNRGMMDGVYGVMTRAEAFARHFLEAQKTSTWGDVANHMRNVIRKWQKLGIVDPERILDAGCGPLTLERWLEAPVYGIDMNQFMIELGKQASPLGGPNARVGNLSDLPEDWTGQFELVAASLVMDYSSIDEKSHGEIERLRILRELVRVCHSHGLVWFTWNESYMDERMLDRWTAGLRAEGFTIREELTGFVRAVDNPEKPCQFWSLVFSPNGKIPRFASVEPYKLPFEVEQEKRKRGSRGRSRPKQRIRLSHERFEVVRGNRITQDVTAANRAAMQEVLRWAESGLTGRRVERGDEELVKLITKELGGNAWRVLERLHRSGVLRV